MKTCSCNIVFMTVHKQVCGLGPRCRHNLGDKKASAYWNVGRHTIYDVKDIKSDLICAHFFIYCDQPLWMFHMCSSLNTETRVGQIYLPSNRNMSSTVNWILTWRWSSEYTMYVEKTWMREENLSLTKPLLLQKLHVVREPRALILIRVIFSDCFSN